MRRWVGRGSIARRRRKSDNGNGDRVTSSCAWSRRGDVIAGDSVVARGSCGVVVCLRCVEPVVVLPRRESERVRWGVVVASRGRRASVVVSGDPTSGSARVPTDIDGLCGACRVGRGLVNRQCVVSASGVSRDQGRSVRSEECVTASGSGVGPGVVVVPCLAVVGGTGGDAGRLRCRKVMPDGLLRRGSKGVRSSGVAFCRRCLSDVVVVVICGLAGLLAEWSAPGCAGSGVRIAGGIRRSASWRRGGACDSLCGATVSRSSGGVCVCVCRGVGLACLLSRRRG